ncbi:hypothetical protein [Ekhidna sp. To15]|uniref:hypothetical protein n=1 Tax=Ekhidna sp. To15 TaxID=3395267 RepID=UPI003F51B575
MRKIVFVIILLASSSLSAQVDEKVLADTIAFVASSISQLQHEDLKFKCYRLNYDDCNLECEESDTEKGGSWMISSFFLPDIDEDKMKLIQQENGDWTLILVSGSMKIKYDKEDGSGLKTNLVLYSKEKEPLLAIGKALYFAIKSCKGLDRFKK